MVKNLSANAGDAGSIPGLAREISWTGKLGGLQSMGSKRVRHD